MVCLLFFAILEVAFWVAGTPTLLETEDPFRGFSKLVSAFEREGDVYRTRRAIADSTINDQNFQVEKSQNGLRIFCLGGSSSYGFPWNAQAAFGGVLADLLAESHPELSVEIVNASGLSYAMHRVNIVADELLAYDPDIFIVYSGHNEFVEPAFFEALKSRGGTRTRLAYALAHSRVYAGMHRLFVRDRDTQQSAADMFDAHVRRDQSRVYVPEEKEAVVTEFRARLERLVRRAMGSGVRVLLATVPCNQSEWHPEASATGTTLNAADIERWRELIRTGRQELNQGEFKAAAANFESAVGIAPGHAESRFLLAEAYRGLKQWDQAREQYGHACDLDASPARRVSAINEAIRSVAQQQGALLVDVDEIFEDRSENGLVGFNLIEDYVHPTREGHELIAWHLWDAIEQAGWMNGKGQATRAVYDRVLAERNSRPTTGPSATWVQNQGILFWKQGNIEAAIQKFRQAVELEPEYAGVMVNLGTLLSTEGRHTEALPVLRRALEIDARDAGGHQALASALYGVGDVEEAEKHFNEALRLQPQSAKIHGAYGNMLQSLDRLDQAETRYREALRYEPDHARALNGLAIVLIRKGEPEKALPHLQKALATNPEDEIARTNLETLKEQLEASAIDDK